MSDRMRVGARMQDLRTTNQEEFGTTIYYRTDHAPEDLETDGYFSGAYPSRLRAGDEIKVSCILDDGSWKKALFEVSEASPKSVQVVRVTDWHHGGCPSAGKLTPTHRGAGRWDVTNEQGETVAKGLDKRAAHAMCGITLETEAA